MSPVRFLIWLHAPRLPSCGRRRPRRSLGKVTSTSSLEDLASPILRVFPVPGDRSMCVPIGENWGGTRHQRSNMSATSRRPLPTARYRPRTPLQVCEWVGSQVTPDSAGRMTFDSSLADATFTILLAGAVPDGRCTCAPGGEHPCGPASSPMIVPTGASPMPPVTGMLATLPADTSAGS